MKNSPLKPALAVFGIAVAIFLSCSDGPVLVFPGKDEPLPPSSSAEASLSSAESSSSGEADNSSSSGEADSSSSAESSSSSEETDNSSSSSEEVSCDDTDKCNGQCYNRETQFCYNKTEVKDKCGGRSYNVQFQVCCGTDLYPITSYACCGSAGYLLSGYGCRNNAVLTRCGTEGLYDPLEQFCTRDNNVFFLCGGRQFDPNGEWCDTSGDKEVIKGVCGSEVSMDYETHFCFGGTPYALCGGKNGSDYNPDRQFCSASGKVYDKCGGNPYDPSTHFCYGGTPYALCGGKDYNPEMEQCCGSGKYSPATQFCYNSSKVGSLCGINPQELYDPDIYQCKPEINPNGIYLKTGITDGRDNNRHYNAVLIGGQVWMAENMNYDVPGNDTDVCYSNNPANCATYGRLYNWATAMNIDQSYNSASFTAPAKHQGICPSGWYLPSDAEWTTLTDFAGGASTAGTKLKAASGWNRDIPSYIGYVPPGSDDYGFSALPGGRYYGGSSSDGFNNVGISSWWWSATEDNASYAYYRGTGDRNNAVSTYNLNKSFYLNSVRCVKDL